MHLVVAMDITERWLLDAQQTEATLHCQAAGAFSGSCGVPMCVCDVLPIRLSTECPLGVLNCGQAK